MDCQQSDLFELIYSRRPQTLCPKNPSMIDPPFFVQPRGIDFHKRQNRFVSAKSYLGFPL
jgi:hypothetical protein